MVASSALARMALAATRISRIGQDDQKLAIEVDHGRAANLCGFRVVDRTIELLDPP
jgi:hypothetical protein